MDQLAKDLGGFLGIESVRDEHGTGITVSYWDSLAAIKEWKEHTAHQRVQKRGKQIGTNPIRPEFARWSMITQTKIHSLKKKQMNEALQNSWLFLTGA